MRFSHYDCPYVVCSLLVLCALGGCGSDKPAEAAVTLSAAFVCTETGEAFAESAIATPSVNPKTGRRTLVRGLYCSKCNKWYPSPPLEVLQRTPGAALCPKTGAPLAAAGPVPEKTAD